MGIKTRFNPMGCSGSAEPYPDIPVTWKYTYRINETGKNVRTLYFYNNTIGGNDVTVPYGYTELQDYQSPYNSSLATLPFYEHGTLTSIDLKNVPFRNNSMIRAFTSCKKLTSVVGLNKNISTMAYAFSLCNNFNQNIQIPNSVTNMDSTFDRCYNFNQNIHIPNNVTTLCRTFLGCNNFNQNIQIPNSVTNMDFTFSSCSNLNQNIQIPNSVTTLYQTFSGSNLNQNIKIHNNIINISSAFSSCHNLNQNIQIPNSVTNMSSAFSLCSNLNQNIQIPNSVTNIAGIFSECKSLNQNIKIPNSVTNMSRAFSYCNSLNQNIQVPYGVWDMSSCFASTKLGDLSKIINIKSPSVTEITGCFYNTSFLNISNQLTVLFPMRFINNVNTFTRNSLVTAGYAVGTGLGITSANATENRNLLLWDLIPYQGYSAYAGNGTHWQLTKWDGRKGELGTSVTVPETITTYDTFPTSLNISTFTLNTDISYLKITNKINWVSNRTGTFTNSASYAGAFRRCYNLKTADISIAEGVQGMQTSFIECNNLTNIKLTIPTTATDLRSLFQSCTNLVNARSHAGDSTMIGIVPSSQVVGKNVGQIRIPDSVTRLTALYASCKSLDTVIIDSKKAVYIESIMDYCNTRDVNVYLNSPDITAIANWHRGYTTTFTKNYYIRYMNSDGTYTKTYNAFNGQAVMRNNVTSNFYMYDISPYNAIADYAVTVTSPTVYYNSYRGMSPNPVVPKTVPFAGNTPALLPTTFFNKDWVENIDCSNVQFVGATMLNAFRLCPNVKTIKNINIADTCTSMVAGFYGDDNLETITNFHMPNSIINAQSMYGLCKNLSNMYINSFGVTQLSYACDYCNTRPINVYIKSPDATAFTNMFRGYNASFRKNIYIYFKYANGVDTKTFNLFKPVLYTGSTGNSGSVSPMYNSASNFYVYNLGVCPI